MKSENTEHEQWNSNDGEMCSIETEPLNEIEEMNIEESASSNQITVITENAASRAHEDKHISSNERCEGLTLPFWLFKKKNLLWVFCSYLF